MEIKELKDVVEEIVKAKKSLETASERLCFFIGEQEYIEKNKYTCDWCGREITKDDKAYHFKGFTHCSADCFIRSLSEGDELVIEDPYMEKDYGQIPEQEE